MSKTVELNTSEGLIRLELDEAKAPATVANFVQYVKDGHYDGTLCVTVAAAPATCGAAEVGLNAASLAEVRVSDVTFQVWLYPSRVSVVVMHGNMQIHGFESGYAWRGPLLQFADTAKNTRYEVRLGERKP